MLLLQLFVCVFFVIRNTFAGENLKSVFFQHVMDCNHDQPVTTQDLELLRNHKFSDSMNSKCLQACVFKKMKWMTSKGMFDEEVAFKASQKDVKDTEKHDSLKSMFNECKKVNDESYEGKIECERASALAKCFAEHPVKLGFLEYS